MPKKNLILLILTLLFFSCSLPSKKLHYKELSQLQQKNSKEVVLKEIKNPLNLKTALALLEKQNLSIKIALKRIEEANAKALQARSFLFPSVGTQAFFLRADKPSLYLFNAIDSADLPQGVNFNSPGVFSAYGAELKASYTLWNWQKDYLSYQAAKEAEKASRYTFKRNLVLLKAALFKAFLDYQAAKKLLRAHTVAKKAVETELKSVSLKVQRGAALQSEELSLKARVGASEEAIIQDKIALERILTSIKILLGLPVAYPLSIDSANIKLKTPEIKLESVIKKAFNKRDDLLAAKQLKKAAELSYKRAFREYLPTFNLETSLSASDIDGGTDINRGNWKAQLALSQPLFDGGLRYYKIKEAKVKKESAGLVLKDLKLKIQQEVKEALLSLQEAKERLATAAASFKAAEASFKLVKEQYKNGAATISRFLQAQSSFVNASTSKILAELSLKKSLVKLSEAVGDLNMLFKEGEKK